MTCFTMDNTEGYTQTDLDSLNAKWAAETAKHRPVLMQMTDIEAKSFRDHLAEQILFVYDNART